MCITNVLLHQISDQPSAFAPPGRLVDDGQREDDGAAQADPPARPPRIPRLGGRGDGKNCSTSTSTDYFVCSHGIIVSSLSNFSISEHLFRIGDSLKVNMFLNLILAFSYPFTIYIHL